jgi:hypothetical protein
MLRAMPKALDFIVRWVVCCTALVAFSACGGGDDKNLGGYSEQCGTDEDCELEFVCVGAPAGLCTLACTSNAQCIAKRSTSICNNGFCYDACTPETQSCPNPELKCMMVGTTQGTCRVEP